MSSKDPVSARPPDAFEKGAILVVLIVAAFLRLWHLERNGFGNVYYAAAAHSGLHSFHNAFFAAYDPAGFVSIDKPPVALWIQILFARAFGFHGVTLHLPQAIIGTMSVFILWRLTRRGWGRIGGVTAAFTLAITPISVAADRSVLPDSLLILTLLLSAAQVLRASETGRLTPLLWGALFAGAAFNIKMLAAFVPLPAFALTWMLGAPLSGRIKLAQGAAALMILVAVSALWPLIVDGTPPTRRPYVGGSHTNRVRDLIFGYNGAGRVLGGAGQFGVGGIDPPPSAPLGLVGGGPASAARLFRPASAPQILWLFPLALLGLTLTAMRTTKRIPRDNDARFLTLWGGWAVLYAVVLSASQGTYHPYYLSALAPAFAALVGAAFGQVRSALSQRGVPLILLIIALTGNFIYQGILISALGDRAGGLTALLIIGAIILIGGVLIIFVLKPEDAAVDRIFAPLLFFGMATLFIAPLLWCIGTTERRGSGLFPAARPPAFLTPLSKTPTPQWIEPDERSDSRLESYLLTHRGEARFIAVTPGVRYASPLILATSQPVMALGGFLGVDPILTETQWRSKFRTGEIRFVLDTNEGTLPGGETNAALFDIARDSCRRVPPAAWRSPDSPFADCDLYDCAAWRTESRRRAD